MQAVDFSDLPKRDKDILQSAKHRLEYSLNKVTNPSTCAVAVTNNSHYFGNNIFLSNDTLVCAEASAIANAVAAGDQQIQTVHLIIGRTTGELKIATPCGNCRQWLHDFARLNNRVIRVVSATSKLDEVLLTDSEELLPGGFKSAGLGRMIDDSTRDVR